MHVSLATTATLLALLNPALAFRPTAFARKSSSSLTMSDRYTIPDQPARFARAKKENNQRYLDIETVYDPSFIKGLRVAVTGANRGIGLSLAKELTAQGAKVIAICRSSSAELEALNPEEVVLGIDVQNDEQCEGIKDQIKGGPVDIVSAFQQLVFLGFAACVL
jgi:C-terminal processing protease CtpA/Prc